jgi:mycothiol synthase
MESLESFVARAPTPALRAAVVELLGRVQAARGHAPLSEHKRMVLARASWGGGAAGRGTDHPAFGVIATAPPRAGPVGYAQISGEGSTAAYDVELLVDPQVGRPDQVVDVLLETTLGEVAGLGGGHVRLWVPQATGSDDTQAESHGFTPERDLVQMRCPLPLPAHRAGVGGTPEVTVDTRPFQPGVDEAAWLLTNNRAFASHPEQGHWELDTLMEREGEAWFDPEGFRVLEAEGRVAGFCWTKVHADTTPPMGEIYVIGVDPDFHGRGWGRALTRAGLTWLAGQGLSVGMLYVDADNRAAVHLYRSMGFTEHHVDRSYVRDVAPA